MYSIIDGCFVSSPYIDAIQTAVTIIDQLLAYSVSNSYSTTH